MALKVGDKAPDFELPSQDGTILRLSDFRGNKAVVLFFYPKDHTPICTREACAFRDGYREFTNEGAAVIGISLDSVESHKAFAEKNALPYPILSDVEREVRKQYGIKVHLGFMPERITFVIDKAGIIRHVYSSHLTPSKHASGALQAVRQLEKT
ncbi:MAG: peroxiredoxin [Nitrospinae bacterium]|nr:peroxiredoxin [Nitrospinota bacterium]